MKKEIWVRHPRIAHYTDLDTLFKIIESKVLWATHFSRLNDTSEFYYSLALISQEVYQGLKAIYPSCPSFDEVKKMLKESLYEGLAKGLYSTSFCEVNPQEMDDGILSMWRSYASNGCYIELDTKMIHDHLTGRAVSGVFDSAIYGNPIERQQELKEKTHQILKLVIKFAETQQLEGLLMPFANLATMLKHPGFHEEKEIRLAIINSVGGHDHQTFEVKLFKGKEHIEWPFEPNSVKKIVVGPHLDQEARMALINDKLQDIPEYNHVEVTKSTIPYRGSHWVDSEGIEGGPFKNSSKQIIEKVC